MQIFFDDRQLAHAPELELHNGGYVPYAEHPGRASAMVAALGATTEAIDHGEAPIARIHSAPYLAFLKSAHRDWLAAGRSGDACGYVWPVIGRRPLRLDRIDANLGQFSFDASTPIAAATWDSAYWSAQTALSALAAVLGGEPHAFALCRPPGHHAGADYLGGYCYLNNAAIVAEAALNAGRTRVAVLDIDYHHGNGTQDVFYTRGDALYVSIHADPATDYPFYWGHAEETGMDAGEGATLNLPLPRGTVFAAYEAALIAGLDAIVRFAPSMLVISFGADTFENDPISRFRLKTGDYTRLAARIASIGLPTVIVMEGGYAVDALGDNVAAFLAGF